MRVSEKAFIAIFTIAVIVSTVLIISDVEGYVSLIDATSKTMFEIQEPDYIFEDDGTLTVKITLVIDNPTLYKELAIKSAQCRLYLETDHSSIWLTSNDYISPSAIVIPPLSNITIPLQLNLPQTKINLINDALNQTSTMLSFRGGVNMITPLGKLFLSFSLSNTLEGFYLTPSF